jgi:hypothetical protein
MGTNNNGFHQDGIPLEKYKFDKEADQRAKDATDVGPINDINGEPVTPTADAQKARYAARVKAQMTSHKNPKNRAY